MRKDIDMSKLKPLVSVIIPIYNVEKYLEKCLVTVTNQTYENLQIILVDDGSTDDSATLCKKWVRKDPRIELHQKANGGLSSARNYGLKFAKGKYVSFVDSDDWLAIDMIYKMVNVFLNNDVQMVTCQFLSVYSDGRVQISYRQNEHLKVVNVEEMFRLILEDQSQTNHIWRKMFKRDLIPEKPFDTGRNFEDMLAMPYLLKNCSKVACLKEALYFYRQRESGSILSSVSPQKYLDWHYAVSESTNRIIQINPALVNLCKSSLIHKDIAITISLINNHMIKDPRINKLVLSLSHEMNMYMRFAYHPNERIFIKLMSLSRSLTTFSYFLLVSKHSLLRRVFRHVRSWIIRLRESKDFSKQFLDNTRQKFVILGTPDYGNLGDQALKFAEYDFISDYFSKYSIVPVPIGLLSNTFILNKLNAAINTNDIVSLQAGGNIGTLYPGIHKIQQRALQRFEHDKAFIFPQTLYFSNDPEGQKMLRQTDNVYKKMDHFMLTVRDNASYRFANNHLKGIYCEKMPDMALRLKVNHNLTQKRAGALILLRNDSEQTMDVRTLDRLLNILEKKYGDQVWQSDTHIHYDDIDDDEAKIQLNRLINQIERVNLVITDRLHGMIFSAITNTPCVVLPSKSPKIVGVYEWIKNNHYIILEDNINHLATDIDKVVGIKNPTFSKKLFDSKFDEMTADIKEL